MKASPALPLALTLAVHLLLAFLWLQGRTQRAGRDDAPAVVTFLLPAPVPVAPPAPAVPRARRAQPARASAPPASPPSPSTPTDQAITVASPAPADAPPAPSAADILARAKRDVGPIERELRGGKSGVPAQADTPWARFRLALESAHVDEPRTARMDSYTWPDGTVIYRTRIGGKVICRSTGGIGAPGVERSAGAVLAGAGSRAGGGSAGTVDCPSDVQWERR
jgi:hypothetical protein